jgi:hypothetical protein
MIQNIEKGRAFRGALNYVLEKPGAELIGGNMAGETPRALAAEFRSLRDLRPDVETAVFHASLSAPVGERLTEAQWAELTHAYAQHMGFGESAYVVVRHRDQDHDHVHVIASRIDVHGHVVRDQWDRYLGQQVLRRLEREYGLTQVAPSWETPHRQLSKVEIQHAREAARTAARARAEPFVDLAREHAAHAFAQATSWADLERRLAAHDLRIEPRRGGLVVTDGVAAVKASAVGHACSRPRLEQRFQMTYADWREERAPSERERAPGAGAATDAAVDHSQHSQHIHRTLDRVEERERLEGARANATERALRVERELTTLTAPRERVLKETARTYSALLTRIYRDRDAADRGIETMVRSTGVPATLQAIRTNPGVFGELKGRPVAGRVVPGSTRDRALKALPELAQSTADYVAADQALRTDRARVAELTTSLHAARAQARELGETLRALPTRSALLRELGTLAHELEQRSPAERHRLDHALSPPHHALLREATASAKEIECAHDRTHERDRERDGDPGR